MRHLRDVLSLPILAPNAGPCDLTVLERVLLDETEKCAEVVSDLNGGPIATCLSGGISSSLSLAMLRARFPQRDIIAYTMGLDTTDADIAHATEVASRFRVKLHRILIPRSSQVSYAAESSRRLLQQKGLVGQVDGSIGTYLLFRHLQEDGLRAILHHDGADELFGGTLSHRHGVQRGSQTAQSVFDFYWHSLEKRHLWPTQILAAALNVCVVYPYLRRSLVKEVTKIAFEHRSSPQCAKIPLRDLASRYRVPESVIGRAKRRFRDTIPPPSDPVAF